MSLSCTVTGIYSASSINVTLKLGLGVSQGHWKWNHSIDRIQVPTDVPTMTLPCIISEIKRDIGGKSRFFIPYLHSTPTLNCPCRKIAIELAWKKCGYLTVNKFEDMFSRLDTIPACDRQTDRHLAIA